jgi:hypothetical protein
MKKENINKEKGKGNKREKWRIGPLPRIWHMEQLHARGPAREHDADVWVPLVSRFYFARALGDSLAWRAHWPILLPHALWVV